MNNIAINYCVLDLKTFRLRRQYGYIDLNCFIGLLNKGQSPEFALEQAIHRDPLIDDIEISNGYADEGFLKENLGDDEFE